jgi:hypothetical protein
MLVPCTAKKERKPRAFPEASLKRRSEKSLSVLYGYCARSAAGLARYADGERFAFPSGIVVFPSPRLPAMYELFVPHQQPDGIPGARLACAR